MPTFQSATVISGQTLFVARATPVMTPVTPPPAEAAIVQAAEVLPPATVVTTPAVNEIRFVDPDLARRIVELRLIFTGSTPDKVAAPVAPAAAFPDHAL